MTLRNIRTENKLLAWLLSVLLLASYLPPVTVDAATQNTDGYYEIRTIEDLYNVRSDLAANYVLMNDIDLTDATAKGGDWDFDGRGWNPIGSNNIYGSETFSGIFDGNGHAVKGLRINVTDYPAGVGSTVYLGLFTAVSGTVKNLTVEGSVAYTNLNNRKTVYAGAIAARVDGGTVENCTSRADVSVTNYDAKLYVGGLVGYMADGSIIAAQREGKTTASGNQMVAAYYASEDNSRTVHVGGIAGLAQGNSMISRSFQIGDVTAETRGSTSDFHFIFASGIACLADGASITDCYNSGAVAADRSDADAKRFNAYAAGIAYIVPAGADAICTVNRCYNVGTVTTISSRDYQCGGTASYSSYKSKTYPFSQANVYYLSGTGGSSTGATALTESQMKLESMFVGFDFENVWVLNPYANHPYPQLRSNIQDMNESVQSLTVLTLPDKLAYMTGEALDLTGLALEATYVSGRTELVTLTEDMVAGFDSETVGEKDITVTVGEQYVTFTVQVTKAPEIIGITLLSGPETTDFAVGTAFDFTGAVIQVSYDDGSETTLPVDVAMTTGGDIRKLGTQMITVALGGFTVSFPVTVTPLKVTAIAVKTAPAKVTYIEGETLDAAGLVVRVTFNSGKVMDIASGFTLGEFVSEPGQQTVAVYYGGQTTSFTVSVAPRRAVALELRSKPNRLEYVEGQALDLTGMVLIATYDSGISEVATDYTVSGYDGSAGIQTVTVSVGDVHVGFTVQVAVKVMEHFEITSLPAKLQYIENEPLDTLGLVATASYNDGTSVSVTDYELTGFSSVPGTHRVYVSYNGAVDSFEITVRAKQLVDLRVTQPTKTAYYLGESFDPTGMIVTAYFDNGISYFVEDYTLTGFDSATEGVKTLTVTYGDISRTLAVSIVRKNPVQTNGEFRVALVTARLDEEIAVPVAVTKNPGLAGLCHTVSFDPNQLTFLGAEADEAFAGGTIFINADKADDGEVTVLWYNHADVAVSGIVYRLLFSVKSNAVDGTTEIALRFADNGNANISGEDLIFNAVNGGVEILSYWLGDLDGNRTCTMADLLLLAQYVSGQDVGFTEKQMLAADVNEDEAVDIHDVLLLQQWLLQQDI